MKSYDLIALALIATLPQAANAMDVNDKTRCAAAVGAFEAKGSDNENIRSLVTYIKNTADALDAIHTDNGEPGVMAQLSDEDAMSFVGVTIAYCHDHPKATLYNGAAFTYRGLRDIELQLGTAK